MAGAARANPFAVLALACGFAVPMLLVASRYVNSNIQFAPGNDAPFMLMMAAPASAGVGLLLSFVARAIGKDSIGRAAFWLNLGWSVMYLALFVFFAVSFTGR